METILSAAQVRSIFSEEIAALGGSVHEVLEHGNQLFARGVCPSLAEVLPGDHVQGGVAVRSDDAGVDVFPYTFRVVCRNGAIRAHALEADHLVMDHFLHRKHADRSLRETIRACAKPAAFTCASDELRSATLVHIDMLLMLARHLEHLSEPGRSGLLMQILSQLEHRRHGTRYELMNAVTATARQTSDPEIRWKLEKIGALIATEKLPPCRSHAAAKQHPHSLAVC